MRAKRSKKCWRSASAWETWVSGLRCFGDGGVFPYRGQKFLGVNRAITSHHKDFAPVAHDSMRGMRAVNFVERVPVGVGERRRRLLICKRNHPEDRYRFSLDENHR